jgi:hypothetical protein
MKMVTVFRSFNMMEAELIRSRLEASQFTPIIEPGLSAIGLDDFASKSGGFLVQVPDDESEEAASFIAAPLEDPTK